MVSAFSSLDTVGWEAVTASGLKKLDVFFVGGVNLTEALQVL